jgi:hypothetical protein
VYYSLAIQTSRQAHLDSSGASQRTTCSQEGENDENITISDMTMLIAFKPKANLSYIMIIFAKFDELMMCHDICSLSLSEIHTWIKKSTKHIRKAWRTKEVEWGPSPSVPTSSTRHPRHFWPKDGKRSRPTRFGR